MHIVFPYTISLDWFKKLRFEIFDPFKPQTIKMSSPVWQMEMSIEQFKALEIKRIKPVIRLEITVQNLHVKEKVTSVSPEDELYFEYTIFFHNEIERNKYIQIMSEHFGIVTFGKLDVKKSSDAQYAIAHEMFRRNYDYNVSYHKNNIITNLNIEYEHLSKLSEEEKCYRKANPRCASIRLHPTGEYIVFLHFEGDLSEYNHHEHISNNVSRVFAEEISAILKAIRLKLMFK